MKQLVITTSYPASDADPSGHFVRTEARALARQGHEVHVVAPGGSPFDESTQDPAVASLHVHPAGGGALFGWPGAIDRARRSPARLLHALPFAVAARARASAIGPVDRAIAHWIVPSAVPLLLGFPAPLEVVGHGADVRLLCAMPAAARLFIVRSLLDRDASFRFAATTSLDALSRTLPAPLAARLERASRIEPVLLDLPDVTTRAHALRAALDPHPSADKLIVTAGRLVPGKRVDLAIEAATSASMSIVIVGDGPLRAELEALARARRTTAHFVGLVPRDEALAWIAAADVLLHASAEEAAPTVVREARALGVPVVACAAGDVAVWARHDPGLVVAPPDVQALSAALQAAAAART
ncbi:glycosyltransferase family 4 protein [Polyangium sp. y55x31]|uniref:glycosyltransferase family 4 protein n=1 Tax=Polyangium sp. y55x31 TaxID=3042688 RepID=UPI0024827682|nr:glycosyltransferase family 4 protein [Polyangium sp. y55x31]MDI1481290.1 glycosyltransferase family 4 protein [Polyangium sp. y55x31]